jgi:hypothetical protein
LEIDLVCDRFEPNDVNLDDIDLIAVCDGAASTTRAHFSEEFGEGNTRPFSVGGTHLGRVDEFSPVDAFGIPSLNRA